MAVYVSDSVGNDTWTGLAPEYTGGTTGPKKTFASANTAMGSHADKNLLLRANDKWRSTMTLIAGVRYATYGEGSKPEVTGADLISGGNFVWNNIPDTYHWYVTLAGGANPNLSTSVRLFIDGVVHDPLTPTTLRPYGFAYGNAHSLGFNTFYIYSRTDPNSRVVEVTRRAGVNSFNGNNVIVEGILFSKCGGICMRMAGNNNKVFRNIFEDCERIFLSDVLTNSRIENNVFKRCHNVDSNGVQIRDASNNVLVACNEFSDIRTAAGLEIGCTGTVNVLDNTFVGSIGAMISITNGTANIDNNWFSACSYYFATGSVIRTGGIVNWGTGNRGLLARPRSTAFAIGFTANGLTPVQPKFVSTRGEAFVAFSEDDNFAERAVLPFTQRDLPLTYALHVTDTGIATAWVPGIQSAAAAGVEFVTHTRGHATLTVLGQLRIRYTGAGTCSLTITADYANRTGTLSTVCSNPADNITGLSLSAYPRMLNTYVESGPFGNTDPGIIPIINALPNYECQSLDGWTGRVKTFCLESISDVALTSSWTTLMMNNNNFLTEEIIKGAEDIENIIGGGYEVSGLAYPNGAYNEDVVNWLKAQGKIKYARIGGPGLNMLQRRLDLYTLPLQIGEGYIGISTIEEAREIMWGILSSADAGHAVYMGLHHQTPDYTFMHLLMQAATEYVGGARIASMRDIYDHVKTGICDDGRNYYLYEPDQSDYRLRHDSDLIGAGNLSAIAGISDLYTIDRVQLTDINGNLLVDELDTGAYWHLNDPVIPLPFGVSLDLGLEISAGMTQKTLLPFGTAIDLGLDISAAVIDIYDPVDPPDPTTMIFFGTQLDLGLEISCVMLDTKPNPSPFGSNLDLGLEIACALIDAKPIPQPFGIALDLGLAISCALRDGNTQPLPFGVAADLGFEISCLMFNFRLNEKTIPPRGRILEALPNNTITKQWTIDPDAILDFGIDWINILGVDDQPEHCIIKTMHPSHILRSYALGRYTVVWVYGVPVNQKVTLTHRMISKKGRIDEGTIHIYGKHN